MGLFPDRAGTDSVGGGACFLPRLRGALLFFPVWHSPTWKSLRRCRQVLPSGILGDLIMIAAEEGPSR